MKIRPARPDEIGVLTALCMRSKQSNGYDDAFMAACREELTVTQADLAVGEYWVAEAVAEADAVCGCACLLAEPNARSGEIHAFFIDPEQKRQGIGRLLWQKLLERAQDRQLVELYLDADPNAVPFYQDLGFVVVGSKPSGSIPGREIPHMRITL
ncbi:MAG: GNAT family N-acetyltransferase [Rhodospirillaceae bacterium]|jgi:N-acetylglutamate synthase-like GNAT family acetyltransferase|nr:GNAT family N-acetyltransferase [Rhodospirillaceae bacterium]MBT3493652.1 GNAT family N-acetyltransferase [Rhodospirillaceae bacterium]MBT3782005.1 GNAT family N-acetyltransferase [Rhodospirillaceae bacterium]MBT3978380.1 GNAT family N-acetyltransferase [Rhodospirillaceae bacterium]MBT4169052.1 GNAT family N-acetyltransferase [Rhodospirillaceae bacterium]